MTKRPREPGVRDAEIGNRIRVQRLAKDLTQGELAKVVDVTFQQVQKYENGKNHIKRRSFRANCGSPKRSVKHVLR